jgi:hypothetical protein
MNGGRGASNLGEASQPKQSLWGSARLLPCRFRPRSPSHAMVTATPTQFESLLAAGAQVVVRDEEWW